MSAIDTTALRAQLAIAGAEHYHVVSTKTWCSGICDQFSGQCDGHETGDMTNVGLVEEIESDDDLLCLYGANGQAEARAALIGNVHANTTALLDEVDRLRAELAASVPSGVVPSSRGIYKFSQFFGRMGELEGVFTARRDEVEKLLGTEICFGEVLGKHSDIRCVIDAENLTLASDSPEAVKIFDDLSLATGINPLGYLSEE